MLVVALVLESAGKIGAEQSCQLIYNQYRVRESAPDIAGLFEREDDDEHEDD